MSEIRFAPSTERSLRRALEVALAEAERRAGALRADARESLDALDVSDLIDGEANDPSTVHRGEALGLAAANDQAIEEILAALHRLDHGSYGSCERCHGDIPIARLRALPATRWCVACSRDVGSGGRLLALAGS